MSSYIQAAAQCNPSLLKSSNYNAKAAATSFVQDPTYSSTFINRDSDDPTIPIPQGPREAYCAYRSNVPELTTFGKLSIQTNIATVDAQHEQQQRRLLGGHSSGATAVNGNSSPALGVGGVGGAGHSSSVVVGRHLVNEHEPIKGVQFKPNTLSHKLPFAPPPPVDAAGDDNNKDGSSGGGGAPKRSFNPSVDPYYLTASSQQEQQRRSRGGGSCANRHPLVSAADAARVVAEREQRIARLDALHKGFRDQILSECEPSKAAPRPFRTLPEHM